MYNNSGICVNVAELHLQLLVTIEQFLEQVLHDDLHDNDDLHSKLHDKLHDSSNIDSSNIDSSNILKATDNQVPILLNQALCYAILGGGKRLRPLLTIASAQLFGVRDNDLPLRLGCVIELIHSYSLIHDDLPAMDDDDLRRGQLSCHKKFGEDIAILAGDAIQALAFELLSSDIITLNPETKIKALGLIAYHAGRGGMVGGQVQDCISTGKQLTLEELQQMHSMKTGGLISVAILLGYLAKDDFCAKEYAELSQIATQLGILFQIVDDIIDITSDTKTLGKTANKDIINHKATYVNVLGVETAQALAKQSYTKLKFMLGKYPGCEFFLYLLELIYTRDR
jgi:farnesyl diphosphate synthase